MLVLIGLLLLLLVILGLKLLGVADLKKRMKRERWFAALGLLLFAVSGCAAGGAAGLTLNIRIAMAVSSGVAIAAMLRAYAQYRFFAMNFATTVWRDFLAYALSDSHGKPK